MYKREANFSRGSANFVLALCSSVAVCMRSYQGVEGVELDKCQICQTTILILPYVPDDCFNHYLIVATNH